MLTQAAARSLAARPEFDIGVHTRGELMSTGITRSQIRARIAANRWRAIGIAVVLDNGELTRDQRWRVALLNCGPRAALAGLTAAEHRGLAGWERDEIHVLVPAGCSRPSLDLPIVLHRTRRLEREITMPGQCQLLAPALALAAANLQNPRPACGLLAAGIQQRLTTAGRLRAALCDEPNNHHRTVLLRALEDMEMGAQALSEIDFVRLCRSNGLPRPRLQSIRLDAEGRRRYLDVEWQLASGRRLVAEVDGAMHLLAQTWFADQLRQNEVVISGSAVLRFPSVIVRTEPALVIDQLRRAMHL